MQVRFCSQANSTIHSSSNQHWTFYSLYLAGWRSLMRVNVFDIYLFLNANVCEMMSAVKLKYALNRFYLKRFI